ncbi:MAG: sulfotransferase [Porticoccaceae bacterium]|nr:MAG: sulfotransferase [Porticoccaceae bacterium]
MFEPSDGVKKALIIASTELLPRPWRVALRRDWLARLEVAKARRARLIIIGHPKSGNTWLKVMISRLYQVRYGLPSHRLINTDELSRRHPGIPRLAATNGAYSYEGAVGRILARGAPDDPLRHKPVLFLARHPIDIAVSWYHQFTKRQSRAKQELINHAIAHPIDRRTIGLWEFVRESDIGLPFLIDYLNTWYDNVQALPNARMVRYEDLRAEPAFWLREVLALMGEQATDEEIAEAVSFASFDNLRKLEASGHFRQGGMRLVNPRDPNAFKTRRGKVGGYREDFTPGQVAELEALVRERLNPAFGYAV